MCVDAHASTEREIEKINKTIENIRTGQENIMDDMEGLRTTLLERIKKTGNVDSVPEGTVQNTDLSADDGNIEIIKRLDDLDQTVGVLERYVYDESVKRKNDLRNLQGDSGEAFDANMYEVRRLSEDMVKAVDDTLVNIRENLKQTELTANARNVIVGDLLYYHGISSRCDAWFDSCVVEHSECRDDMCQCVPGFSHDSLRQRCVPKCPHGYGDTYQVVHNYIIRGFNNRSVNETSLEECKLLCETEKTFECRSFDFFPNYDSCYLSEKTKGDAESGWEYNGAGVHFQRDCVYDIY